MKHELDSAARDTSAAARQLRSLAEIFRQAELVGTQETLARLGYGIRITGTLDDPTKAAIREFERYHGLPVTGSFDSPELVLGLQFVDRLTKSRFGLPDAYVTTSSWPNIVRATGSWAGREPARNTTEVWCYRASRMCREAFSYILEGELYVATTEYDIEHWDTDELRARSNAHCLSEVLTINRASASAVVIRSPRNLDDPICKATPPRQNEVLRLVSGRTVSDSLLAESWRYVRHGAAVAGLLQRLDSARKARQ